MSKMIFMKETKNNLRRIDKENKEKQTIHSRRFKDRGKKVNGAESTSNISKKMDRIKSRMDNYRSN